MRILGVIVAGGKSSRMGGNEKALLDLDGASLIERVHSRVRFQVEQVVINSNGSPERFAPFSLPVIPDRITTVQTPLAGLHAALIHGRSHGFDAVLTVPCDTPFLPLDLVTKLEDAGRSTGATIAVSMSRKHYLTGLWSTALAPVLDGMLVKDNMVKVKDFVHRVETAEVAWDVFPHDPFLNINTPEDLSFARLHLHA
jgi:molybdenum cofactor guanylyltransferase